MIQLQGVSKNFRRGSRTTSALEQVDLELSRGSFLCLRGPSGSGKTTLLMILGGMLRPSSGTVQVRGQDLYALNNTQRAAFRRDHIGFVFQMFYLLPYLDVLENLLMAGSDNSSSASNASRTTRASAEALLEQVGLGERKKHRPSELSAGERQRVAMARALVARPSLLLADEPTGNLDPENAGIVLDLLADFHRQGGTVVLVTHGQEAEAKADRLLCLEQGRIG